ncbi:MAG: hypothetical protein ACKPJO_18825 [Dolichospermum sp.]
MAKPSVIVDDRQLANEIMRPSLNKTSKVEVRCTQETKEDITRKLIAVGYKRSYNGKVNPDLVSFLKDLSGKSLEWFEKNFSKTIDKSE